jgi:hypothetical protein
MSSLEHRRTRLGYGTYIGENFEGGGWGKGTGDDPLWLNSLPAYIKDLTIYISNIRIFN